MDNCVSGGAKDAHLAETGFMEQSRNSVLSDWNGAVTGNCDDNDSSGHR
jgi:hypothetical protein